MTTELISDVYIIQLVYVKAKPQKRKRNKGENERKREMDIPKRAAG